MVPRTSTHTGVLLSSFQTGPSLFTPDPISPETPCCCRLSWKAQERPLQGSDALTALISAGPTNGILCSTKGSHAPGDKADFLWPLTCSPPSLGGPQFLRCLQPSPGCVPCEGLLHRRLRVSLGCGHCFTCSAGGCLGGPAGQLGSLRRGSWGHPGGAAGPVQRAGNTPEGLLKRQPPPNFLYWVRGQDRGSCRVTPREQTRQNRDEHPARAPRLRQGDHGDPGLGGVAEPAAERDPKTLTQRQPERHSPPVPVGQDQSQLPFVAIGPGKVVPAVQEDPRAAPPRPPSTPRPPPLAPPAPATTLPSAHRAPRPSAPRRLRKVPASCAHRCTRPGLDERTICSREESQAPSTLLLFPFCRYFVFISCLTATET